MQKKTWGVVFKGLAGVVAIFVVLFLAGVGVGFYSAHSGGVDEEMMVLVIVGLTATLIMALALWMGVAWMRSIDEAAQEAHKAAWFYGGSAGMAVGGVIIIMASLPQAEGLILPAYYADRTDPAVYAASGAFFMMTLMLIGYTIMWLWWWWRRR